MATRRSSDEAPYDLSRSALRERYGSRRIDASAPQSANDFTPSGRERRALMAGSTPQGAVRKAAREFDVQFNPLPAVPVGRPMGWGQSMAQENPLQKTIRNDIQSGAVNGTYPVPGGGVVGFGPQPTPLNYSLSDPSPVGANTLSSYLPTTPRPTGYIPSWKKTPPASYMSTVLNGASKWLA